MFPMLSTAFQLLYLDMDNLVCLRVCPAPSDLTLHSTQPHLSPRFSPLPQLSNPKNKLNHLSVPTFGSWERASFSCPLALGRSSLQDPRHLHCCRHHCQTCCLGLGAGSAFPCLAADSRSSACSNLWLSGSALHGTWLKCLVQLHLHCLRESPQLWGLAVLLAEPPCPPGAHWQSHCSLRQSPIPHWLGLSSGLTDRET